MHDQVRDFVADAVEAFGPFGSVIEFGSLDINGSVRPLFTGCRFTGIDLVAGPGVDVVADAATWTPAEHVDCVVCCEVFEHTPDWPALVDSAARALCDSGVLIVTCAGPGRGPHSAVDGNALRDGEHYANVTTDALREVLVERFTSVHVEQVDRDVRAVGVKTR